MKLLLIRHGRTIWNTQRRTQGQTDIPLDAVGEHQAQCLAQRLQYEQIDAIYSSPLLRACSTAERIAALHDIPVRRDALLMERNFGVWEGVTMQELKQQHGAQLKLWQENPFADVPEGSEPLTAVAARCGTFIKNLLAAHTGEETVLVVSHAVVLRILIGQLIGLPGEKLHNIQVENAALSMIECKKYRNVLCVLNDGAHLE